MCFVATIFTRTCPDSFSQLKTDTTRLRATPSFSPCIQPGARISTVTFSPLEKTSGMKGRRHRAKVPYRIQLQSYAELLLPGPDAPVEELPPALGFHSFGRPAVPVVLELLDTERREPFAGTNLLRKPDQFRDLRVIDPRQVDRRDKQVDRALADRFCGIGKPVDIVPVDTASIFAMAGSRAWSERLIRSSPAFSSAAIISRSRRVPLVWSEMTLTSSISFRAANESGKLRIHERFARRIDMTFHTLPLERGDLLYRIHQVVHLDFIAGGTRF